LKIGEVGENMAEISKKSSKKSKSETADTKKKGKKAVVEGEDDHPVVASRVSKKKRKAEFDWLIIPIIIVGILIALFFVKIGMELLQFSREVDQSNTSQAGNVAVPETVAEINVDNNGGMVVNL
jgi:hypothetical protein